MKIINEAQLSFRNGDWGVKYMSRGPEIEWGVILLPPGQASGCHRHERVEETFYVLEGNPTLWIDGKETMASPGTAFQIPAPEAHEVINNSNRPAKVVFIKAPYLPQDKIDCKRF